MTAPSGRSARGIRAWLAERPILAGFGAVSLAVAAMVATALYLDGRLETIEDRLRYRPPRPDAAAAPGETPVAPAGDEHLLYVPAYSHIYSRGGAGHLLEITLSVRNTDPTAGVTVTRVDYYDTDGRLVRRFLDRPLALGPLGTTEFLVEEKDAAGGSGANFVVGWSAAGPVSPLLCEAVMIGLVEGRYGVSFARPAVPIEPALPGAP